MSSALLFEVITFQSASMLHNSLIENEEKGYLSNFSNYRFKHFGNIQAF